MPFKTLTAYLQTTPTLRDSARMETNTPMRAIGVHRDLGRVQLEVAGGLLALHHAHPGMTGSVYFPAPACTVEVTAGGQAAILHAVCEHRAYRYEVSMESPVDIAAIAEHLAGDIDESAVPRRPVQLEHEWPWAAPWHSVVQLSREMTRTTSMSLLALPAVMPYAWLRLRRDARQHAPAAVEGFRQFTAGDFDAAQDSLREALAQMAEDYDAFYLLLHAHLREYAFDDALACATEFGMESKLRASHLDNEIRLLQGWHAHHHEPLFYRETKDREGIGLIGQEGEALTMLRPAGKVRVGERVLSARTEGAYASAGETVTVIGWDGVSVIVRPALPVGIE